MSGPCSLTPELSYLSPAGPTAEPQIAGSKKPEESNSLEERKESTEEEDFNKEDDQEEEEEEEMTSSALLKPQTDGGDDGVWSEKRLSGPEESDAGISGGSQHLSEEQSQAESDRKSQAKWRESMPEGERWRDDEIEAQQRASEGDGSLAGEEELDWNPEKANLGFTPQVTIVRLTSKQLPDEGWHHVEKDLDTEPQMEQFSPEGTEEDDKYYVYEHLCSEKLKLALATAAAGILFPLLVWGGYALLPFDSPLLESGPLRVVYTLRCSFFATIPILLGVLVQGVARLRYGVLRPLYQSALVNKEVAVHLHYVNESLALFLFYFLQLAVMATYVSQDLVKLVPLLTIIFVFGRLIYWLCLSLGSSIRAFGFGFSFFPILVMLGVNLYYTCSSVGHHSVFDVAPPTTAPPPPKQRWWG